MNADPLDVPEVVGVEEDRIDSGQSVGFRQVRARSEIIVDPDLQDDLQDRIGQRDHFADGPGGQKDPVLEFPHLVIGPVLAFDDEDDENRDEAEHP